MDVSTMAAKSDRADPALWLPFVTHAMDTAGIMGQLFQKWLPEHVRKTLTIQLGLRTKEETCGICKLLGLLHDIGKLTPAFQTKITGSITGHTAYLAQHGVTLELLTESAHSPHPLAGQVILVEVLDVPQELAEIVGLHHGRWGGGAAREQLTNYASNYYGRDSTQKDAWKALWREWLGFSLAQTGFPDAASLPAPDLRSQMLLTGLLITADWIASNTDYFPYVPFPAHPDPTCEAERVTCGWQRVGFPPSMELDGLGDIAAYFDQRFRFMPCAMQEEVVDTVLQETEAGLYILEAPMGLGKTEAALAAAEYLIDGLELGGIYFGLPTQATANGVFGRIRDWAAACGSDVHTIRLAHGMTDLNDEYQAMFHGTARDAPDDTLIVHEWFEGRKQALLSDHVVATIDQFLLASLKQKHVMLRHLGLAGKVVILDECHAYDAYMNVYLDRTLAWMGAYHVPVIVLSATLPPQRRKALLAAYLNKPSIPAYEPVQAYPVLTWTRGQEVCQKALTYDRPEKEIRVGTLEEDELASTLGTCLADGGCAGVIVNSVAYAQTLSRELQEALPTFRVICFHSRFIATDRAKIEQSLMGLIGKGSTPEMRDRVIVVGTQVLEQSLDIDLDVMVTELCPMDLLLQRSGRLHRHPRRRPPRCEEAVLYLLHPAEERRTVYSEWILQQTQTALPEMLHIPSCIPELVAATYDAKDEESELYQKYRATIQEKEEKANQYCIRSNALKSRRTRRLTQVLDDDAGSGIEAEASVRDTDETIEVLVLRHDSDGRYSLLSGEASFDTTQVLEEAEAKRIARERLRLPLALSNYGRFRQTVDALEMMPPRWRESPWLRGELLLLLDEAQTAQLSGYHLQYTQSYGLEHRKEG